MDTHQYVAAPRIPFPVLIGAFAIPLAPGCEVDHLQQAGREEALVVFRPDVFVEYTDRLAVHKSGLYAVKDLADLTAWVPSENGHEDGKETPSQCTHGRAPVKHAQIDHGAVCSTVRAPVFL